MKRLAVLLAFSTLGTGCVVSDTCDARTVSIGWSSFRLANNTVVTSCTAAGVSDVDVLMDDTPVATVSCADGGLNVTRVLNDGNHLFTVEAIDSVSGAIALRDEVTVGNNNCSDQLVDTQPSEGTFVLDFSFTPDLCQSATNSYIWFTLHDDISHDMITVDGTHRPTAYTCGAGTTTPTPISFALPSGPFTLDATEEVLFPGPSQEAGNCNATAFTMSPGTQSTVTVPLTDGISCF